MPHELHASIVVSLPEDPKSMVDALATISSHWSELLSCMKRYDGDLTYVPHFDLHETRAKVMRKQRTAVRAKSLGDVAG